MSKRTILIVILIALALCAILATVTAIVGVVGWAIFSPGQEGTFSFSTRATTSRERGSGTLRLVGSLPPTLDPAIVQDSTSAEYIVHLFSGLVSLDADLNVIPDLASEWAVDPTGVVYTFVLRSEASFADGRSITADDVVYSWERALAPSLASPVALAYLGDVVGARAFASGENDHVVGVRALDVHTLEVEIEAPRAYFLPKLTYPVAFVVDREQVEDEGDAWMASPNGSGPFILDELSMERIVLVRNDRYHRRLPYLERIEYLMGSGLPMTMYENGQLDLVGVSADEMDRVTDPYNPLSRELLSSAELSVHYLGFNIDQPPFDDIKVRQAIAMAIDRESLAKLVLNGTALPAHGIMPPGLPQYSDQVEGLVFDPKGARERLAESCYVQGAQVLPEIVLTEVGTSGYMSATSRAVLHMLEENLGIIARVEQVEWGDFLSDLNRQRYGFFVAGWMADYPDAQNFCDLLFHSASSQNHSGYSNPMVDQLLERAGLSQDEGERAALYRQAEELILQDAPWIPLTHGLNHFLVKPYVHGVNYGASLYPWLTDVYIEDD